MLEPQYIYTNLLNNIHQKVTKLVTGYTSHCFVALPMLPQDNISPLEQSTAVRGVFLVGQQFDKDDPSDYNFYS